MNMKKRVLLSMILLSLLFIMPFTLSENNGTIEIDDSDISNSQIKKAYDCLENRVDDECSSSLEDNIFTLLAIKKCKEDVLDESTNNECWPKSSCKIKTTAQAILALNKVGTETNEAEKWLISQNKTSSEVIWYLQIESPEATTCTITYSGSSHKISIGEDRKINSGAGSCLSLSEGAWWLRISPSCYEKEFEIQCHDSSFMTSLLFKKQSSSTIYVSSNPHSASSEGTTTEKVYSICFGQGTSCDYEGSLWATLILDYLDYEISYYLPYLIAMTDENTKYLPEAFLYLLTGETDFRTNLLEKQKNNQYWMESSDKFYDTALALYPFQNEMPQEKTSSMSWLLEVQDNDGCWGSIKNTAFILHSIWPNEFIGDIPPNGEDYEEDCVDSGYYCMSSVDCEGKILSEYSCSGTSKCCDTPKSLETCSKLGGEVCGLNEECSISTIKTSDVSECCTGYCKELAQESNCERYEGNCRSSCFDNEEETNDECDYAGEVCCVEKEIPIKEGWPWWIWLLIVLIILVILGIIFRDKLRPYWFRIKSKFGGKSGPKTRGRPGPGYPLSSSRIPLRRPTPRRIFPPIQNQPVRRPSPTKRPSSEIDDILKKLKEMGK
jgi:hypothetical protein